MCRVFKFEVTGNRSHRHPVTPVGASLLAIHSDGAQDGDFTARRGIREQARSYRAFFRR